jgi:hypothetical protein
MKGLPSAAFGPVGTGRVLRTSNRVTDEQLRGAGRQSRRTHQGSRIRPDHAIVVSQAEGVGGRIENADPKNAINGSNATTRSVLYSTWKP